MTRKILLVDDDSNFRRVLALALELQGYLVRQASCGQSALDVLQNEIPDLIISDFEMSGMDGAMLFRRTRACARLSNIPFVILSAFVNPGESTGLADLPADRWVSKQISFAELNSLIHGLLDGSAQVSRSGSQ